jgi:hypothetical protein
MQDALATAPKTTDRKHGRGGKGWGRLRPGGRARSEKDHTWEQMCHQSAHASVCPAQRGPAPHARSRLTARAVVCPVRSSFASRARRTCAPHCLLPPPPPSLPVPPPCSPRQALAGKAGPAEDDEEEEEEIAPARPAAKNAFSAFALLGMQHLY